MLRQFKISIDFTFNKIKYSLFLTFDVFFSRKKYMYFYTVEFLMDSVEV